MTNLTGKQNIWFSTFIFVVSGGLSTIVSQWQDTSILAGSSYSHPAIQDFVFELALSLSYLPYYLSYKHIPSSSFKQKAKFLYIGVMNSIESILLSIGLFKVGASLYQISKASVLLFTVAFSIPIIGRKPNKKQIIGVGISATSICMIGLSSSKLSFENAGIIIIVLSQLVSGFNAVMEEKLLSETTIHNTECIGIEGIGGLLFNTIILIPIFCSARCDISESCLNGRRENISLAIKQTLGTYIGVTQTFLIMIATMCYNISSISLNFTLGATTRAVIDCGRMLLVWVFCLSAQWEKFTLIQLLAYAGISLGIIIYNDLLPSPRENINNAKITNYGTYYGKI